MVVSRGLALARHCVVGLLFLSIGSDARERSTIQLRWFFDLMYGAAVIETA